LRKVHVWGGVVHLRLRHEEAGKEEGEEARHGLRMTRRGVWHQSERPQYLGLRVLERRGAELGDSTRRN
jgi:hypothetical protein